MRQAGRISNWNDDKGFGFVTPHEGGARAFVHVKAFQVSGRRPVEGDLISYETEADAKGRLNATSARFAGQRVATAASAPARKPRVSVRTRVPRVVIGASFLVGVAALWATDMLPAMFALAYLVMSLVSYFMYALDKEIAGNQRWRRTPESTLHLLDVLGGWPGGLIAQQVHRHKTAKTSFQVAFWFTVILNLAVTALLWRGGVGDTLATFD